MLGWLVGATAGPILGAALLVSLLGGGALWTVKHFELADMQKQRDEAQDRAREAIHAADTCAVNLSTLDVSLTRQNQQIKEWQDQGVAATRRAQEASETVRKTVLGVRANVEKLLSAPAKAPVGSFDACKLGIQTLRGGMP